MFTLIILILIIAGGVFWYKKGSSSVSLPSTPVAPQTTTTDSEANKAGRGSETK
jgi:hypothetical protein